MIKKIIYTVLVFFSLWIILNYWYSKILIDEETKSIHEIKRNFNWKIEYLFLGDSHPKFSVNPLFFNEENVYNFSFSTINYISIYHNLEILLEKENIKIENIYLELDPHNFSEKRYINNWLKNYKFYYKYYDSEYISKINNQEQIYVIKKIIKDKYLAFVGNYYNILTKIKSIILNQNNDSYYWWKAWLSQLNDLTTVKVRLSNTYDDKYTFSNNWYNYFEKTIKLAKKHNININFIRYPLSKEYLDKINKSYYKNYLINAKRIIDSNIENYNIYDYSNFYNTDYTLFNDPDHLNKKWATFFSKELYNKIILWK